MQNGMLRREDTTEPIVEGMACTLGIPKAENEENAWMPWIANENKEWMSL